MARRKKTVKKTFGSAKKAGLVGRKTSGKAVKGSVGGVKTNRKFT